MAISGTITLLTASTNMSTFDLYSCTSSNGASCSGTAFETNITRNQLLNGFVSNSIPDGTTYIKINPNSAGCLNQYIIVELSGAPTCSFDATIVYGLPSVTLTPTPTQTQTPTGTPNDACVLIDYQYNTTTGLEDGCNGSQRTDYTARATLFNYYGGSPINATETITITLDATYSYCLGNDPTFVQITINSGSSYGEATYVAYTYNPCPYDQQCLPESTTINGVNSISPNTYTECLPPPSATPTPTPTIPTANGQCYTYTLDYGVSTTDYGVSYVMVGVGNQIVQFNSLPSNVGPGDSQIYYICSEVEPTLLDTSNWPSTMGIGYDNGISRTGPNGYCSTNFDCYTN